MLPVLYNIYLQLIYFIHSSLYLLIPYSYLALLPTGNHQFVLYTCESISVLLYSFIRFIFQTPHISDNIQYLSFSELFHSIILSRSIHIVANGKISSFVMESNIPVCVCVCVCVFICVYHHIFFIHSSVDGHFICFYILPVVNNVFVNIGVNVSFPISVFFLWLYTQEQNCWILW